VKAVGFIHLKSQAVASVQEAGIRARKIVDAVEKFCKKLGGSFRLNETPTSYIATCNLPSNSHITVDMRSWENYIEVIVGWQTLRLDDVPEERGATVGVIYWEEKPSHGASCAVKVSKKGTSFHGATIGNSFEVNVSKDYREINIRTPAFT